MPAPEDYEEAFKEIEEGFEDIWNAIFSDDDATTESQPTLSKAEQEYEDEHHECPLERNPSQDKPLTSRDINRLKKAGYDPHRIKQGDAGSDLYKDRKGNVYEKPKGGAGSGEPLGINLKELP
jgi:hypothetical protein